MLYWPVVRGCRAFVESLILGYKALEIAAMHAYGDEEEPGAKAEEVSANGAISKEALRSRTLLASSSLISIRAFAKA